MALKQLGRLLADARKRWSIQRAAIVHRLGDVALTETSVSIAVACAHRGEAFDACQWLISTLKKEIPIWKREVWADGHETWVQPAKSSEPIPEAAE